MSSRTFYELRTYQFQSSAEAGRFGAFVEEALIPAYERAALGPIGVFAGVFGPNNAERTMVIPYPNADSVAETADRLLEDSEFLEAGRAILGRDIDHPSYYRMESRLLRAFSEFPEIELPHDYPGKQGRIFELRIYESHSLLAAAKKREMFNEGGEIEIFRKTGLSPVLFGETIVGPRMPSLAYLLTFESMAARDDAWNTFKGHPEWEALKGDPQYADTVSTITDVIFAPTAYSQM